VSVVNTRNYWKRPDFLEATSRRYPFVMMMPSPDLWHLSDRTHRRWLNHSRLRCIHLQ
jgi:hypothetical protein